MSAGRGRRSLLAAAPFVERRLLAALPSSLFKRPRRSKNGIVAVVLGYHRVLDAREIGSSVNRGLVSATTVQFEQQMRYLSEKFDVVRVRDLPEILAGGGAARRPLAAVTFDDGYRDNIERALPILEACGVPATVYLTTDFVEGRRAPWWESLAAFLQGADAMALDSPELEVPIRRALGKIARERDGEVKARLVDRLVNYRLDAASLPVLCAGLSQKAGHGPGRQAATRAFLTPDEVRDVAERSAAVDFGAHTLSHPHLVALTEDAQRAEIAGSADRVSAWCGRPVGLFAYPYGKLGRDYDQRTVRAVRELGFESACTLRFGMVDEGTDPYEIPRMSLHYYGGMTTFFAKVNGYVDLARRLM